MEAASGSPSATLAIKVDLTIFFLAMLNNKRLVFRHTLDSPFKIQWPEIKRLDVDSILAELARVNDDVKLVVGMHSVTQCLQSMIDASKADGDLPNSSTVERADSARDLRCIILCRGDIQTAHTYSHLPVMAHYCGSIPICALPAGCEQQLAASLRIKRCTAIGIHTSPSLDPLNALVCSVTPPICIPWLGDSFAPLRIKTLKTNAGQRKSKTNAGQRKSKANA